jgi:hypothetical protein
MKVVEYEPITEARIDIDWNHFRSVVRRVANLAPDSISQSEIARLFRQHTSELVSAKSTVLGSREFSESDIKRAISIIADELGVDKDIKSNLIAESTAFEEIRTAFRIIWVAIKSGYSLFQEIISRGTLPSADEVYKLIGQFGRWMSSLSTVESITLSLLVSVALWLGERAVKIVYRQVVSGVKWLWKTFTVKKLKPKQVMGINTDKLELGFDITEYRLSVTTKTFGIGNYEDDQVLSKYIPFIIKEFVAHDMWGSTPHYAWIIPKAGPLKDMPRLLEVSNLKHLELLDGRSMYRE